MYTDTDVAFWSNRYQDHMNFLVILLDPVLVSAYSDTALSIKGKWSSLSRSSSGMEVMSVLGETVELKRKVLSTSYLKKINRVVSKDTFTDMVDHMLEEALYLRSIMEGDMSVDEEISFWGKHARQTAKEWLSILTDRPDMRVELEELYHRLVMTDDPDMSLSLIYASQSISEDLYKSLIRLEAHVLLDAYSVLHEVWETEYGLARIERLLV